MSSKALCRKIALILCVFIGFYGISCKAEQGNGNTVDGQANLKYATIIMESGAKIVLELYIDEAPITVNNFIKLADSGFYDGLVFHRAVAGLIIQGGDPLGNGYGGSDETIKGEFASNGIKNNIKHLRGTISMARSNDPDSASSQFFLMSGDYPSWDGSYAAFGKIISGIEAVDEMSKLPVTDERSGEIIDKPVIKSIRSSDTIPE